MKPANALSAAARAYKDRMEWLEAERKRMTAEATKRELDAVESALNTYGLALQDLMAAHAAWLESHGPTNAALEKEALKAAALIAEKEDAKLSPDEALNMLPQANMAALILQMAADSNKLSEASASVFELLYTCAAIVAADNDELERRARAKSLKDAAADTALDFTITPVGRVIKNAIHAADSAASVQSDHANSYMLRLESLRKGCDQWVDAVTGFLRFLGRAP